MRGKRKNEGIIWLFYIPRQETEHQLSKLCSVIRSSSTLSPKQSVQDHSHSVSYHHHNSWCEREGVNAHYIECLTIVTSFCFQLLSFCSLVDLFNMFLFYFHFIMLHCAFDLSLSPSLPPPLLLHPFFPPSLYLSLSLLFPLSLFRLVVLKKLSLVKKRN